MKKAGLLILISCLSFLKVNGQVGPPSPNDLALRETIIDPAEYIFEATVLQTKNYTTKEGSQISQAILEIHKVFRGDLKAGTVEIVTCPEGWFFNEKENSWYFHSLEHSFGNCWFAFGHTDLFLGTKAQNISPSTDCPVTNKFVMQQLDRIHYSINKEEFYSKYAANISGGQYGLGKSFKTLQDLYDFILDTPGTKLIDFDQKVFQKLGRNGLPLN